MAKWIDRSHPQVTTGAVILGYIAAFSAIIGLSSGFGELGIPAGVRLLFPVAFVAGAYGTANNKKIGHLALSVAAVSEVALQVLSLILTVGVSNIEIVSSLRLINSMVFSVALVLAVLHRQTLEHRRIWFE